MKIYILKRQICTRKIKKEEKKNDRFFFNRSISSESFDIIHFPCEKKLKIVSLKLTRKIDEIHTIEVLFLFYPDILIGCRDINVQSIRNA